MSTVKDLCTFGQTSLTCSSGLAKLRHNRSLGALLFEFAVSCPAVCRHAAPAIAASRAGALGIVDLQFSDDHDQALAQLANVSALTRGRWGVHVDDVGLLEAILTADLDGLETIVISAADCDRITLLLERVRTARVRTFAVATCLEHAAAAHAANADAVIAKGHEAGGWVAEEGSFVLLQRLVAALPTDVWVQGGIGLHTVAAANAAGAAGVVLDGQLLLTRESALPSDVRAAIAGMDGSETTTFGTDLGAPFRVYARPGLECVEELRQAAARAAGAEDPREAWRASVKRVVRPGSLDAAVLPLGQDAAFAADLARRFVTVAGIISALRSTLENAGEVLKRANPLAPGAPLARSHGTRYPIVQGPMTRVSDVAPFAASVADAGALPFLALALMRAPEADALLTQTRELIGQKPWGVGILGFVPPQLRAEQLEVVRAHRPPFALIAGGRPDQAKQLEDEGIATYLHVPSPGLLQLYLAEGARRFVFEGRECGGHVGPRTSFVLWEQMLQVLLAGLASAAPECHVLFAGGIHDARSAAMVAATAAAACQHEIRAGVLLGTAYLFTREATERGAITATFQQAAIAAGQTVLLESGPGHATRCLPSPFVAQFEAEKRRLRADGVSAEEQRARLEQLNVGRLRIAAKGTDRNADFATNPQAPKLAPVDPTGQWDRGMYMIGQVGSLRDQVTTLADLHRDISEGSGELLAALEPPATPERPAPAAADVAIIGLACILPGATDVGTFWANILGKVDAIGEVPPERWDWREMYDPDPNAPDKVYSRWGGFIDAVPFDPLAIGLPPKSLASIEPFQLLALITAQAALRDAGYDRRPFDRERTSVILGAGGGGADLSVGYTVRSALPSLLGDAHPELERQLYDRLPEWTEDSFAGLLMNVAAGRIANRLDLGGTNYTVDAACASSLAAIGAAVRELQTGTSDTVLAGGVDAIQNPFAYLCFSKTRALSPRGRCRSFDATADGIAISEGFATVVLKRVADAERDGDRIYAVIRGVGAASDGRDRSLTAPRPEGQMRALRRAYSQAGFSPSTVGLVEAHGTGTVAGDGAEVQALSTVFAESGAPRQGCAIGSVKSMIGHTKATAGVAGLIKAALALHHRVLPPTIGVNEPNPKANFPESPFYVNSEARPWLSGGAEHPRRAAVSAFGFGGTDFHVVLEEYTGGYVPAPESSVERWPGELLLWRGTREEIAHALDALVSQLQQGATPRLADLALSLSRATPAQSPGLATLALVVESLDDLQAKLETARPLVSGTVERMHTPDGVHWAERPLAADGAVAFMFPGQGSQVVDMARELAIAFPEAREPFELADRILAERYEQPLSRYIFPPPSFSDDDAKRRQQELTDTHVAQPALGATELAYLTVLGSLGVEAEMTAGHSFGEFVALAAAGSLDSRQLLTLAEARGRFMREAAAGAPGAMAAVEAEPGALEPLLNDGGVVAANLNGPRQTVISGPRDRVEAAVAWCREHDLTARMLPVACAFHSPHVAPAQERLAAELKRTEMAAPRIPVYSNTTGRSHTPEPAAIAEILCRQLVEPVRFAEEVRAMHEAGARIFIEVGPRAVLSGLVDQILGDREHLAVAVHRPGRSGLLQLLHGLAALAAEGVEVRHERLMRGRRAEPLNLDRLVGQPETSTVRAPWVVDGGAARPALRPAETSRSPSTPMKKEPSVTAHTTNGNTGQGAMAVPERFPPAVTREDHAPPAAPIEATPPGGGPAAGVMAHYQRVMQQFLETERDVMLGYLGATHPSGRSVRTIPSLPANGARALPAPPRAEAELQAPAGAPSAQQPEAATLPAPSPPVNGSTVLKRAEIQERLLAVVSERTGYPAEMLGLDADMEGDLGIDSIKRVEIAGTFTQALGELLRGPLDMEELTASRTLREVVDLLETALGSGAGNGAEPIAVAPPPTEPSPFEQRPAETERIGRFVVRPAGAPAITSSAGLATRGAILIMGDDTDLGEQLAAAIAAHGETVLLRRDSAPQDESAADELAAWLSAEHGGVKALVHLAGDGEYGGVETLFLLTKSLQRDLAAAADSGGAAVLAVTSLGGAFGVEGGSAGCPVGQRALAGFLKTLALEWPSVRVKAIDFGASGHGSEVKHLLAELLAGDGLVEVGYRGEERTILALEPAPFAGRDRAEPLDEDDVLLVTGGARGITAEVAASLADRYRPTLLLVGRTPIVEEPAETNHLVELADLRQAVIERRSRAGDQLTPALVEQDCRAILRTREARANIARLRATGARVEYHQCDVADTDAFAALLDRIYEQHGRINGVVHGAGLIEDRLVIDKRSDSLERVMATKARSAQVLAEKLRPDMLRFLVLFSSVSGRFGNRGQADYAAASEVLAELAHELDRRWDARVVAIDWGPWRGTGMVSPALEQEFARRGVTLIGVEEGCRLLQEELAHGRKGEPELVIGAASGIAGPSAAAHGAGAKLDRLPLLRGATEVRHAAGDNVTLRRTFTLAHDRYLGDHRVDGQAVVPFAVAMELMSEGAMIAAPGRRLAGLQDIRLLHGITVADDGSVPVLLTATPRDLGPEVEVTIAPEDGSRPNYRAIVTLREPETAQAPDPPETLDELDPFPLGIEQAYRDLLFHGPRFQGISAIQGMDDRGSTAQLRPSAPEACVAGSEGLQWLLDPVLIDSALQVQVLWARLQWDVTLLPAEIASYTWTDAANPGELVRHELRIRPASAPPMCHADHWFYGSDGRLLATLGDVVGVGTQALNRLSAAPA